LIMNDLTFLHCVSEYPTKPENLQLNQIDWLRKKYPWVKVGFSSHEKDGHFEGIMEAACKGVDIIEFHVGVTPLPNGYSQSLYSTKEILEVLSHKIDIFGEKDTRVHGPKPTQFMRRMIDGKMWWMPEEPPNAYRLHSDKLYAVDDIMVLIEKSGVVIPKGSVMYLSHHYGLDKFRTYGAAIIECFSLAYCKKIIVQLPNQIHPRHRHLVKEEAFHVLWGELKLSLGDDGGEGYVLHPGDWKPVELGQIHGFAGGPEGVVFEEISSKEHENDSYYKWPDEKVHKDRKTKVKEF